MNCSGTTNIDIKKASRSFEIGQAKLNRESGKEHIMKPNNYHAGCGNIVFVDKFTVLLI